MVPETHLAALLLAAGGDGVDDVDEGFVASFSAALDD